MTVTTFSWPTTCCCLSVLMILMTSFGQTMTVCSYFVQKDQRDDNYLVSQKFPSLEPLASQVNAKHLNRTVLHSRFRFACHLNSHSVLTQLVLQKKPHTMEKLSKARKMIPATKNTIAISIVSSVWLLMDDDMNGICWTQTVTYIPRSR